MNKVSLSFVINCGLTCLTAAVMLVSCSGCTMEELQHAQAVTDAIQPAVTAAGPALVEQPWYVFVLLAADIASSVVAALIAAKKKQ